MTPAPIESGALGTVGTVAIREVLSFRASHLGELYAPCTLTLRCEGLEAVYGAPLPLLLTTSRTVAQEAARAAERGEQVVCLTPLEYEALAVALADGRVTRAGAHQELAHKARAARQGREHRLTAERLLGPVRAPDGGGETWTVGELCGALGAGLEGVAMEGETLGEARMGEGQPIWGAGVGGVPARVCGAAACPPRTDANRRSATKRASSCQAGRGC